MVESTRPKSMGEAENRTWYNGEKFWTVVYSGTDNFARLNEGSTWHALSEKPPRPLE